MKIEIEKPVIPQFVADWIEQLYGQGFNSDDLLEALFSRNYEVAELKIFKWFTDDKERAVTAILYGYEIEQPLYQVIFFKEEDRTWTIFLSKEGKFVQTIKQANADYLTEQEIKDIDERFWPFAVKVEEDE